MTPVNKLLADILGNPVKHAGYVVTLRPSADGTGTQVDITNPPGATVYSAVHIPIEWKQIMTDAATLAFAA